MFMQYSTMVPQGLKQTDKSLLNFNVEKVLNSGQTFRHYRLEPKDVRRYLICSGQYASIVEQAESTIRGVADKDGNSGIRCWCKANESTFWENYWGAIDNSQYIDMHAQVSRAVEEGSITAKAGKLLNFIISYGEVDNLRILRQDWWETCVAFTLTSNNNILRVRKMMETLCALHGDADTIEGEGYFKLPGPDGILELLARYKNQLGLGFRAKYLESLCVNARDRKWSREYLVSLGKEGAQWELMRVNGIGSKISDCIMLFGLGFGNVLPIDVWIERALEVLKSYDVPPNQLNSIFEEHLGLFQQCLYVAIRNQELQKIKLD